MLIVLGTLYTVLVRHALLQGNPEVRITWHSRFDPNPKIRNREEHQSPSSSRCEHTRNTKGCVGLGTSYLWQILVGIKTLNTKNFTSILTMLARITRFPVISSVPRVAMTVGARHMSSLGETFEKKVCLFVLGVGTGRVERREGCYCDDLYKCPEVISQWDCWVSCCPLLLLAVAPVVSSRQDTNLHIHAQFIFINRARSKKIVLCEHRMLLIWRRSMMLCWIKPKRLLRHTSPFNSKTIFIPSCWRLRACWPRPTRWVTSP